MFLVIGLNKIMMAAPMNTWLKSEINENAYSKVKSKCCFQSHIKNFNIKTNKKLIL